jgi:hypothetical protein
MPRKPRHPVATMPLMLWNELALNTGEMLTASAQVIAHRTGRMATAGHSPSLRDRREFTRMGVEKVEAAGESLFAMGQHVTQMNAQLALKAWQDALAAGTAWMAVASSRTLPQMMQRQAKLAKTVSASANSASRLSDATARMAKQGLKPIHSRATANAKRLGRRP